MNAIDIVVFAAGACALFAFVCRLDGLRLFKHRLPVIVMHGSLAIACGAAMVHAWQGTTGVIDAAAVAGSLAWIVVSLKTWRQGVPRHFETAPVPLDEGLDGHEEAK